MKYIPSSSLAIKKFREENKPDVCPITFRDKPINGWHLDHDHRTGMIRQVISGEANKLLGHIENCAYSFCSCKSPQELSLWLHNLAAYINLDYSSNPYHPVGLKQLECKFRSMKSDDQKSYLSSFGISPGKNTDDRAKQYLKHLKTNGND